MIPINLIVEDALSKAIAISLLDSTGKDFQVRTIYDNGGYGYIKSKINAFNKSSKWCPYLVITDLDREICPPLMILQWFGGRMIEPNLIFRVAVREIEAWLLADRKNFSKFFDIPLDRIPQEVESLEDPKRTLIHLVQRSRKRLLRERIVPEPRTKATQGPDYNGALIEFIQNSWQLNDAASNSRSLGKALDRLRQFNPNLNDMNAT